MGKDELTSGRGEGTSGGGEGTSGRGEGASGGLVGRKQRGGEAGKGTAGMGGEESRKEEEASEYCSRLLFCAVLSPFTPLPLPVPHPANCTGLVQLQSLFDNFVFPSVYIFCLFLFVLPTYVCLAPLCKKAKRLCNDYGKVKERTKDKNIYFFLLFSKLNAHTYTYTHILLCLCTCML